MIAKTSEPRRTFRQARRLGNITPRQQRRKLKAYRRMEKLMDIPAELWTKPMAKMAAYSVRALYEQGGNPWR